MSDALDFNKLKILRRGDNILILSLPRILRILTAYGSSCKSASLKGSSLN